MGHILEQGIGTSSMSQEKYKVGPPFGQPYLDQNYKVKPNARPKEAIRSKSSDYDWNSELGSKTCNDDELVKHMSSLPGFLQRAQKENNIQEKALNFGVLDWKSLEKWRYNERMPGKFTNKASSSSSSLGSNSHRPANGPPKIGPKLRKPVPPHGLNPPNSLSSRKQPITCASDFSSSLKEPTPSPVSYNSLKEEKGVSYPKEGKNVFNYEAKVTCNQESHDLKSRSTDKQQKGFHEKVEFYDRIFSKANVDTCNMKESKKKPTWEEENSSSELGKHMLDLSSHDKTNSLEGETRFTEEVNSAERRPTQLQNTMLLTPNHFSRRSCSGISQFTDSRISLDGQLTEPIGRRLSNCFSPLELYPGEFSADDVPHSCPLPTGDTTQVESATKRPSVFVTPVLSEGTIINENACRPSSSCESSTVAEQGAVKGRPSSPTRRFSFSLGKMSRSFSFKESSAVPQLSSQYSAAKSGPVSPEVRSGPGRPEVKSGLVRPEVSSIANNSEREKGNTSSRKRSSPLRRLLDPLLKHKGAQSAETISPLNRSLLSMTSLTTGSKGQAQDRKPETLTFQALLQLTMRNGLPFFKLVVDNSSDMLAAVAKSLPPSGKSDSCLIYAFYSVHEVKKKSTNWMGQGSKSKSSSSSLGYKMVGQMKISGSYHPNVKAADPYQSCSREYVLYGFDGTVDKQTPACAPNKEIAAIVVKNSIEKFNDREISDEKQSYKAKEIPLCGSAEAFNVEETKGRNSLVVVLPGGIHGIPVKGVPSPLLSRWRSGGSCDCGGWDVGCKLQILCDDNKNGITGAAMDRVSLYVQGGEGKSKPVLSFEPLNNGFYSIELDTSISLLEAFATCVAHVTCRSFSEILDPKNQSNAEIIQETILSTDKMKTPTTFEGQVPAKYVTCPPLSPAGRI